MTEKDRTKSFVIEETIMYASQWMDAVKISYQDEKGEVRSWDCMHRKHHAEAVIIIPRMVPSGRYILIKQFRPPVAAYILEFPAGLIEPGETVEQTALRELKEETGYSGRVLDTTPRLFTSPGTLSEACYFVSMEIDETLEANQSPQPTPDSGEFIEVFTIAPQSIGDFVEKEIQSGSAVDIKFYTYFMDLS